MKSMNKVITTRFGAILLTLSALIASAMYSFNLTNKTIHVIEENTEFKDSLMGAKTAHYAWALSLQESIFTGKEFDKTLDPTACALGKQIYDHTHTDAVTIELMKTLEPIHKEIHESAESILVLSQTDKATASSLYTQKITSNINTLIGHLDSAIETKNQEILDIEYGLQKVISISNIIILIIGLLIIFTIAITFLYVKNNIAKPVLDIIEDSNKLAKGNLNLDFTNNCDNEIGLLGKSLQSSVDEIKFYINDLSKIMENMSNKNFDVKVDREYIGDFKNIENSLTSFSNTMSDVLNEIRNSSDEVSSGVEQISHASQTLASGATEQSGSIQELNSSLNEFSSEINETVKNLNNINSFVENTGHEVINGNQKMQEMNSAMKDISEKSNEISKIIKTIDDIAFQTNILALNAAVEAARAGSAGKGFSVVADEVRNLAQKSAQAANDTTKLIEDSINSIENGVTIADETSKMLLNIVNLSNEISDRVSQVSNVSNGQLEKIEQIVTGVEQISDVVQMNSATSEESAAASDQLNTQAEILNDLVSEFKYKKENMKVT